MRGQRRIQANAHQTLRESFLRVFCEDALVPPRQRPSEVPKAIAEQGRNMTSPGLSLKRRSEDRAGDLPKHILKRRRVAG